MEVLIVNQTDVVKLLPMKECITRMREAFEALGRGEALNPLRHVMALPDEKGWLGLMPAYSGDIDAMGLKVISIYPSNQGTRYDSHQGAVLLFEAKHGSLLAIMDASSITAIRTAAVSAVATDALARPEAGDLAILGSGVQAHTHLEAMLLTRNIRRIRVWSRNLENAESFSVRESKRWNILIEPVATAREAVAGADIICTVTSSLEPVLRGDWLSPGAHINAVGSSVPFARELDTPAVARARLFVDRLESTLNEAGDFLLAQKEEAVARAHIQGEIGDILSGKIQGRQSDKEITLFKSLGLAIEDLASAHHIYQKARAQNAGAQIEFGGTRLE